MILVRHIMKMVISTCIILLFSSYLIIVTKRLNHITYLQILSIIYNSIIRPKSLQIIYTHFFFTEVVASEDACSSPAPEQQRDVGLQASQGTVLATFILEPEAASPLPLPPPPSSPLPSSVQASSFVENPSQNSLPHETPVKKAMKKKCAQSTVASRLVDSIKQRKISKNELDLEIHSRKLEISDIELQLKEEVSKRTIKLMETEQNIKDVELKIKIMEYEKMKQ